MKLVPFMFSWKRIVTILAGVWTLSFTISASAGVGVSLPGAVWPNSEIPYFFGEELAKDPALPVAINELVKTWNATGANVKWVPVQANTKPSVKFALYGESGCSKKSPKPGTGRILGESGLGFRTPEDIHVVCFEKEFSNYRTLLHEMAHRAGLDHEHQHCKSDEYGKFDRRQSSPDSENFTKLRCEDFSNGVPVKELGDYDPLSITHYKDVITEGNSRLDLRLSKLGGKFANIGNLIKLSKGDIESLNKLYPSPPKSPPPRPIP